MAPEPEGVAPVHETTTKPSRMGTIGRRWAIMLGLIALALVAITVGRVPAPIPADSSSVNQLNATSPYPSQAGLMPPGGDAVVASVGRHITDATGRAQQARPLAPVGPNLADARVGDPADPAAATARPEPTAADKMAEENTLRRYQARFGSGVVPPTTAASAGPWARPAPRLPAAGSPEALFGPSSGEAPTMPDVDTLTEKVVAAMARYPAPPTPPPGVPPTPTVAPAPAVDAAPTREAAGSIRPRAVAPLHRVNAGQFIESTSEQTVVGGGPLRVRVSTDIYAHDYTKVIPQGSVIVGETLRGNASGEERLNAAFTTVVLPNGDEVAIADLSGLSAAGDLGLTGHVNRHLVPSFLTAGAIGVISGLGQAVGQLGTGRRSGGTVVIGDAGSSTSQAANQAMSRSLNPIPTVTLPAGTRVHVYLRTHLDLPAWTEDPR